MTIINVLAGQSIQAAINSATAGDTIVVAAGTYNEEVTVNKSVTIQGANAGTAGSGTRGAETVITGGLTIAAANVVVDGFKFTGAPIGEFYKGALIIADANATVQNSVFEGPGSVAPASFGVTPYYGTTGIHVTLNFFIGYDYGVYEGTGSSGTVDFNVFNGNGSGVALDGTGLHVSFNTFTNSTGAHIAVYAGGTEDLNTFVGTNSFDANPQPVRVLVAGADGTDVTGTNDATTFRLEYQTDAATFHGGTGSDTISYRDDVDGVVINLGAGTATSSTGTATFTSIENATGGSGNDTLTGNGNANVLNGRGGTDTVIFHGSAADGIATQTNATTIVVNGSGGGDGTDTLIDVEKIHFQSGTPANAADDVEITVVNGNALVYAVADTATAVEAGGLANGTGGTNPVGNVLSNDINLDQIAGNLAADDVKRVTIAKKVGGSDVTILSGLTIDGTLVDVVGNYGTLKIAEDGSYQYVVNQAATDFKDAGDAPLTDTFVYTVSDDSGFVQVQQLVITITPVNDAPTISGTPLVAGTEDIAHVFTAAQFNFADVDTGDTLQSVKIVGVPTNGTLLYDADGAGGDAPVPVTAGQVITAANIAAGKLTFSPASGAAGSPYATFTYQVNDGQEFSATATMTINLAAVNDGAAFAPGGNAFPSLTGTPKVGVPLDGTVAALSDPDGLTSNGSPTYRWQSSTNGTGWTNVSPDATSATFTPTSAEAGKYLRVVVTVVDNQFFASSLFGTSMQPTEAATGQTATIDQSGAITPVDINVAGSTGAWDITTGNGNDHITTGAGNDHVKTGSGNDVVKTNAGDDTIVGGAGNGDDVYDGGPNSDTVDYSSATSTITVNLNAIDRSGEAVSGADGPGGNPDTIGELLLAAGYPANTPVGKASGADIGTDALLNVENVIGGSGGDIIIGDGNANTLSGGAGAGDDTITGGGGSDIIDGGGNTGTGDTAVYSGDWKDYTVTGTGPFTITDNRGSPLDGSDTVSNVENFQFANVTATAAQLLNDAPVGVNDTGSATEKGGINNADGGVNAAGNVLTNDTDADSGLGDTKVVSALTGGSDGGTTFSKVGAYGTVTITKATGAYTYTVNQTNAAVQALYVGGASLTDTFTYTVTDAHGLSSTASLAMTINGADDTATITTSSVVQTESNLSSFNFFLVGDKVTITELDADDAAAPTKYVANSGSVTDITGQTPPSDTLADLLSFDPATGAVVYDRSAFNWLGAGQNVVYTITFDARSGNDAPQQQTLTVTIQGQNDAPVLTTLTHPALNGIGEHDITNPGQTVASFRGPISDADASALTGIAITALDSGNGEWQYKIGVGGTWTPVGVVTNTSALLLGDDDYVRFVPNNTSGTTGSLTYRGWDQSVGTAGNKTTTAINGGTSPFSTATDTATITVAAVNDAPVANDDNSGLVGAVAAIEAGGTLNAAPGVNATGNVLTNDTDVDNSNASLVVSAVRTGSSEGAGTPGPVSGALVGLHGTLTLNADGTYTYVVNQNDSAVQALKAGQFTTDSFNYTVRDPGGLTDTGVLTITINGANDAPVAGNDTGSATEAGTAAGSNATGDVLTNDTDVDNTPLTVSAVRKGGTEGAGAAGTLNGATIGDHGTLTLNANGSYSYAVNDADSAVQALNAGQTITDSFNYTVLDSAGGLTDTAVLTVTINGANDAPTATNLTQPLTVTEDTPSAPFGIVVSDVDAGETITATLTLNTPSAGTLSTAGGASYTPGTGVWTITGSVAAVNAALAAVTFVPAPNSTTGATITTHIQDAAGASPANGTITITMTPVNDAPVLAPASPALTGITEDSIGNAGQTVSSFANAAITDADAGAVKGIAITGFSGAPGQWQYHNGSIWTAIGAVSVGSALLLRDTDLVRFQPDGNNGTAATISYRAWDQTAASFNTKVDTTTNGNATAFSTGINTATLAVADVNDAATINAASVVSTENNLPSFNFFLVADKVTISDVDNDDTPVGYVANSGSVGTPVGPTPPSGTLADLLSFDPATGAVIYDRSAFNWLSAGQNVLYTITFDAKSGDDTVSKSLTVKINGENDAPVLATLTHPTLTSINEHDINNPGQMVSSFRAPITDADSGALMGIAITGIDNGNGHWEFSTNAGVAWDWIGPVTGSAALLLRDTDLVRFVPNNTSGTTGSLSYRAWDRTDGGTAGSTVNTNPNGGTTAFSTATDTATILVTPVNDPPVAANDAGSALEAGGVANGTAGTIASGNVITSSDTDDGTAAALVVTAVRLGPEGGGGLAGTVGGALVGVYGTLVLNDNGSYTYTIDNNNAAVQALNVGGTLTDTFNYTVRDLGNLTDVAQLVITINGANDNAIITGTIAGTVIEAGGVFNAITNTPTASADLHDTDVDNPVDTWTVVAAGAATNNGYGTFGVTAAGVWTYTLNNNHSAVQALNVGSTPLTDTFTVQTIDGTPQLITVTINGTNDAAVITGTPSGTVLEAGGVANAITNTPTASTDLDNTDVDNPNDSWTFVAPGAATNNGYGTFGITAAGVWTYTLNNNHASVQALNVGSTPLTDTFTVTTIDGTPQLITVTINGSNDNAIITGTVTGTVIEAGGVANAILNTPTASADLNHTDVDNPNDTWIAVSAGASTDSGYGTFGMTASGTWTYTLNNSHSAVQALNVGSTPLTDTFTVQTADGTAQLITVSITGRNDAAVITGTASGAVIEAGGVANALPGTPTATGNLDSTDVDNANDAWNTVVGGGTTNGYGTYEVTAAGVWTYTLNNNHASVQALNVGSTPLSDTFTVTTVDGTQQVVTVTINGTNDAATISGTTSGTVIEAGGVGNAILNTPTATGNLDSVDVDNTSDAWTSVTAGTPSANGYGSFALTATGIWTYTLNNGHSAVQALNVGSTPLSDSFTVQTVDGTLQTVTITINGTNDAATITGTTSGAVTEAGGVANALPGTPTASGNLDAADVDNDNDSWTVVASGGTSNGYGSFAITANGVWTYTLNNDHATVQALNNSGTLSDSFTVTTVDGTQQVVTVTINGANDAAIISGTTSGAVTEASGAANSIPGTPTASADLNATDVDNLADAWQAVAAGASTTNGYGTFAVTAGGVWTYTVNNSHAAVQALNTGSTPLSDSFTVQTVDGTQQVITVSINGANDAATFTGTSTGSVTEKGGIANGTAGNANASGDLDAADVDSSNTFNVQNGATTTYGTFSIDSSGAWSYTLNDDHATVQALNTSSTPLHDLITVSTFDGTTRQIDITINGANDTASITGIVTGSVLEAGGVSNGTPGTPTASANLDNTDLDNPADTWIVVAAGAASVSGYGTYGVTAAGVWTYTLNNSNGTVQALNTSSVPLTDTFVVQTQDGTAQTITITINGTNDAAVITGSSSGSVVEKGGVANGTPGTATVSGDLDVSDVDSPQVFAVQVDAIKTYGKFSIDANGAWTYTLDDNNALVQALNTSSTPLHDTFTVATDDGTLRSFDIQITGANDKASITGTATGSVQEAGGVNNATTNTPSATGDLASADVDNTADLWNPVAAGATTLNGYGTFAMTAAGVWTYTLNNTLTAIQALTPVSTPLSDSFTVQTVDGTTQTVTISISGANDSPVVTGVVKLTAIDEDSGVRVITQAQLLINVTDVDSTSLVAAGLAKTAGNGTLIDNGDGTWTYTPAANDDTDVTFSYTVTDGLSTPVSNVATLDITPFNDAPVVPNVSTGGNEDVAINGSVVGTDNDSAGLTYFLVTPAGHGNAVVNPNGSYTYTPTLNFNGADSFVVRANDGLTDTFATVFVSINGVNDAPVNNIGGTKNVEANRTGALTGLSISDPDAAGGTMTTVLSVQHGTLTVASAGGAAVTGSGTTSVTLIGTLAQINATLAATNNVVYLGAHDYFGTDTLTMATGDGGNSGTGGLLNDFDQVTINVNTLVKGTTGNDSFTALPGNERLDAGIGVDTITFNFRLLDATITWEGNQIIVDTGASHTVLTGFERFVFTDGTVDNNDGSPLVDDLYYYSHYHDIWNARVDADGHYNQFGWKEGRDPSAFFSTNTYLAINQDVKAAGTNPLTHFDLSGWKEGRAPSVDFDVAKYLQANPDVKGAGIDPLAHFLSNGAQEGRQPFEMTALYAPNGFDYVYYLQHNPDIAAAGVDPYQHFQTTGWKEGRNPNALFDTNGYLSTYVDIKNANVNPLDHYHTFGWAEGRDPSVNFDSSEYLRNYPDILAAHIDPLKHFLQFGIHEGRLPFADGVWG